MLVIVEHADTGATTLHRADCPHIKRAQYSHPYEGIWAASRPIDRVCGTCKPEQGA